MHLAIVAGNYHQAVNYARKHGYQPREWFYVDDPYMLKGLSNVAVRFEGTWRSHPRIAQIQEEVTLLRSMDRATVVE